MQKVLFLLPFLASCIDGSVNPNKDEDSGDTGTEIVDPGVPTVTQITLTPDPAYTLDVLTATVVTEDGQGGEPDVHWAWFVNGVDLEHTEATLDGAAAFNKGDSVEVTATPYDTNGTGETATASLSVSNTPPTAGAIALSPVPIHENSDDLPGDDLHCALTEPATDLDGDTLSYTISWDVDSSTYGNGFQTVLANDTVPNADLLEGQTWTCTLVASDDESDGPATSESTTVLPPLVSFAECTSNLTAVSAPTTHATASGGGSKGIGAWFADSNPNADSRVWVMMNYSGDELIEYPSLADLQSGSNATTQVLDKDWMGTGHVALNGVVYMVQEDTANLLAVDPTTGAALVSTALPNALTSGAGHYSYGGKSAIDLSADGGKLYAIYSTGAGQGKFVVSELDPTHLTVMQTWNHPVAMKADYATAFIACGVLYAIDDVNDGMCFWCDEQSIDLSWDWTAEILGAPGISWTNPGTSGYISGVSYNPADGLLYVVRGGYLATLTPTFQ